VVVLEVEHREGLGLEGHQEEDHQGVLLEVGHQGVVEVDYSFYIQIVTPNYNFILFCSMTVSL